MSPRYKTAFQPLGVILPLDEVKRRVIIDALDKCRGHHLLAAHLLGIGKTTVYRMAKAYNYEPSHIQGQALTTLSPGPQMRERTD
jgi:transcriptional regulator of acetoin/glycerol metabolism